MLALIAGLLAAGVWFVRRATPPRFQLGRTSVELLGVTVGTNHRSPVAYPWERFAARLPTNILKRLPRTGLPAQSPTAVETLRVWLRCDSRLTGPNDDVHWALNDGHGTLAQARIATGPWTTQGGTVFYVDFTAWPRRTEQLRLEAWQVAHELGFTAPPPPTRYLGAIPVTNPRLNRTPSWAVPTTPVVAKVDDLEVTLDRFEMGWAGSRPWLAAVETNLALAQGAVRIKVGKDGRKTSGWFLLWVRSAEDSTGNVVLPRPEWRFGKPGLLLAPTPWPGETWKLRLELSRNGQFATNELVTLPRLALNPTAGGMVGWQTNFNGVTLEVRRLRLLSAPAGEWELGIRTDRYPDGVNVTLAGVQGELSHSPRGGGLNSRDLNFRFRVPTNFVSVTPTLAVHRSRFVEMLARPDDIRLR